MTSTAPEKTLPGTAPAPASEVELSIGGMTCASCAARIEKKLNRLDGVTATVNYATEKAKVSFPEGVEVADLIATVEKTGYTAEEPPRPHRARETTAKHGPLRRRTPSCCHCGSGCTSRWCLPCPSS